MFGSEINYPLRSIPTTSYEHKDEVCKARKGDDALVASGSVREMRIIVYQQSGPALSRHVSVPSSSASVCVCACVCVFCFKTMHATLPNINPNTRDPPIVQRLAWQSAHPTSIAHSKACQTQGRQRHKEKQNEPGEAKVLNPQDANKKQTWGG